MNFDEILEAFRNGNFLVQMSAVIPFGRIEADKVMETTINRNTKKSGGTGRGTLVVAQHRLHLILAQTLVQT
jgi:hypothetical protein